MNHTLTQGGDLKCVSSEVYIKNMGKLIDWTVGQKVVINNTSWSCPILGIVKGYSFNISNELVLRVDIFNGSADYLINPDNKVTTVTKL